MQTAERPIYGYVRARVMARHSRRPGPVQWQSLENCRGLEHFLQLARESGLYRWVRRMDASQDPGAWEQTLRQDWRDYLAELAAWAPQRWQPVIEWAGVLPMLPALDHLLGGRPARDWMSREPFLQDFDVNNAPRLKTELLEGPWAPLLTAWGDKTALAAWRAGWREKWPQNGLQQLERLEPAWNLLGPSIAARESREGLEGFFLGLLRDPRPGILCLFAHLGLTGLDMTRLRANLLKRKLIPPQPETGQ